MIDKIERRDLKWFGYPLKMINERLRQKRLCLEQVQTERYIIQIFKSPYETIGGRIQINGVRLKKSFEESNKTGR